MRPHGGPTECANGPGSFAFSDDATCESLSNRGSRHHPHGHATRPPSLLSEPFDLLVVGAGIHGACVAWDASLRGFSVAVVDRDDLRGCNFGQQPGIVHGGLRYLARGRFCLECGTRSGALRASSNRSRPGRATEGAGSHLSGGPRAVPPTVAPSCQRLVSRSRNRGLRPAAFLTGACLHDASACACFPGSRPMGSRGCGLVRCAAPAPGAAHPQLREFRRRPGRRPVNYLRVDRLLVPDGEAAGARVTDLAQGRPNSSSGPSVLVAAGPWTESLVAATRRDGGTEPARRTSALAMNIVGSSAVLIRRCRGASPDRGGSRIRSVAAAVFCLLRRTGGDAAGHLVQRRPGRVTQLKPGARALLKSSMRPARVWSLSPTEVVRLPVGLATAQEWPRETGTPGPSRNAADHPNHGSPAESRHLFSVEGGQVHDCADAWPSGWSTGCFAIRAAQQPRLLGQRAALLDAGTEQQSCRPWTSWRVRAVPWRRWRSSSATSFSGAVIWGHLPGPTGVCSRDCRWHGAELGWDTRRQGEEIDARC